jgi:hypothetical protein
MFTMIAILGASMSHAAEGAAGPTLDQCNVVWDTPGGDSSGSMPIGNGDIGLNVWVEDNGDLLLLISKTDAWDENNLLVKVGRVRVSWPHAPFAKGAAFRQELKLQEGLIEVSGGEGKNATTVRVWVDANRPVVCVDAEGAQASAMTARLEPWRTETRSLNKEEAQATRQPEAENGGQVTPDVIMEDGNGCVVWYHRNEASLWAEGMKLQGMGPVMDQFTDPLLHRNFGAAMAGEGMVRKDALTLQSKAPSKAQRLRVYPLTAQTPTAQAWREQLDALVMQNAAADPAKALDDHRNWWREFWNRSWIRISGDGGAETVTRAYALQRWMGACAGRGAYPIKFNGSIFTVEWREKGELKSDPDYRRWGGAYWWQNTRLPYWPMLASGDYDLMQPVFRMYFDSLPLAKARNRIWFGCDGAFMAETMSSWGMFCNIDYGRERDGLKTGEMVNKYIRWIWSSGLDLTMMMLDYYDHTGDEALLKEKLLPWADEMLLYFDTRFKRDAGGKLLIEPTQSIETYQDGVTNDTPSVAGLRAVLPRLLALPEDRTSAEMRARWQRLLQETPELTIRERRGKKVVLPAATFQKRGNCENPELYALFPFRLYGVGRPDVRVARDTFDARVEKSFFGWQQAPIQAAMLGLTDEARNMLVTNAKRKDEGSRFPAFWGPNYDWIPDQDHGGNLLNTAQTMLMQADGKQILLFPAWPKDWDVQFKLHAPANTTVEGVWRAGKLEALTVTPAERRQDLKVMDPQ